MGLKESAEAAQGKRLAAISAMLEDPLRDVTRKERTYLLIISLVAFIVGLAGLVPTKVETLGVEFSQIDKEWFVRILIGVVVYLVVAFTTYALSDVNTWKQRRQDAQVHLDDAIKEVDKGDMDFGGMSAEQKEQKKTEINAIKARLVIPVTLKSLMTFRIGFEALLPILLGLGAIGSLLYRLCHLQII